MDQTRVSKGVKRIKLALSAIYSIKQMSRKRFVRAFNWGMAASMIIGLGVMQNLTAQVSIKRAVTGNAAGTATQMDQMWDTAISAGVTDKTKWFRDAKFGIFIHWGLYSKLGGEWKDKRYYGSGEWIMNPGKNTR